MEREAMGIDIIADSKGTREVVYRDGKRLGPVINRGDLEDEAYIQKVRATIQSVYDATSELLGMFPQMGFAPSGEMVESMGKALAAGRYGLVLYRSSRGTCVAVTPDNRMVQVVATESVRLTILREPDYLIVIKFYKNGLFEEIYNGLTERVWEAADTRGRSSQRPIATSALRSLNEQVSAEERIAIKNP